MGYNYEEKIEEMRRELKRKEEVVSILERLKRDMQWDTMKATDDTDEDGSTIFVAPNEEDWYYDRYVVYSEIIEVIEKHYFK